MTRFLMEAGPFVIPILLLIPIIGLLTLWNLVFLLIDGRSSTTTRRHGIDAVLFWGGVAAVLGFLGQWVGIHRLTRVLHERGVVGPEMVSYGISESLLTPIAGMAVLAVAAVLWFLLRLVLWARVHRT